MGTANPATLRALAATRAAQGQQDVLNVIAADARRAADNAQTLVEQLGGEPVAPETVDEPETTSTGDDTEATP